MEDIISFTKRRGFVYPSSEIYGGLGGVYDYGPYGVELANNIKTMWWRAVVQREENVVGLDASIFSHPRVWEASGHVDSFSDPLVECKECNTRLRADHLLEGEGIAADEKMTEQEINELFKSDGAKIKCPKCGKRNFTKIRHFNMLAESNLGNTTGNIDGPTYLRAETAQGTYINFKNVVDTTRQKVPFGIAQSGKVFRNEISARQFIFRKREFEQMEMQMFVHPSKMLDVYEEWKEKRWQFYKDLGFNEDNLRWHEHENLVFYAKAAWDIEYKYPMGFKEMEGVHARGDYDLTQHMKHSGQDLSYADPKTGEKFVPNVVETAVGVERIFLAVLCEAYTEEELDGKGRTVLKLPQELAPIKAAVFPLLRNKPELVAKAREVFEMLKGEMMCEFDDNGNVGKRYRRQDEIGTPTCVTIDFDTLDDDTVTLRDRDSGKQERVKIQDLLAKLK